MESTRPQTPIPRHGEGPSLITGVAGFVGQYLARHLVEQGETVAGIDLHPLPEPADYPVEVCDLLDFENLCHVVQRFRPRLVYHLAGLTHPRDSLERPRAYYAVNVQGTVNLLEALRQNETDARILIVSSSKVYGRVPPDVELIDETLGPRPETPYAVSKYLAEQVALQYLRNYGTEVVIARPFNHTGPGQPLGFVVPDFCKQVAEIETLPPKEKARAKLHVGDISTVIDLLDARDVVKAYADLMDQGSSGEVYNICSAAGVSISHILNLAVQAGKLEAVPEVWKPSTGSQCVRPEVGDSGKLREAVDWQPSYPLEETIEDTLVYWRNLLQGQR